MSVLHCVVYSGGMDSFTLLHHVLKNMMKEGDRAIAVNFDYDQIHGRERTKAQSVCEKLKVILTTMKIKLPNVISKNSSLTNLNVAMPTGHYTDASMKLTVVPGRNSIMLIYAMSFVEVLLSTEYSNFSQAVVYYGAHSGDHAIYPDCRPAYVQHMMNLFTVLTEGRVCLSAPFLNLTKGQILLVGIYEAGLSEIDYVNTHTCYSNKQPPCGVCGACVERAEAFAYVKRRDPLVCAL